MSSAFANRTFFHLGILITTFRFFCRPPPLPAGRCNVPGSLNKRYTTNNKTLSSLAAFLSRAFVILLHWSSQHPPGCRQMMCGWGHWQGLDKLHLDWIFLMQGTVIKCLLCTVTTAGTGATEINPIVTALRGSQFSGGGRHGNKCAHNIIGGSGL